MEECREPVRDWMWILCPPTHVAHIKSVLREANQNDRSHRLVRYADCDERDFDIVGATKFPPPAHYVAIPTRITISARELLSCTKHLHSIGLTGESILDSLYFATRNTTNLHPSNQPTIDSHEPRQSRKLFVQVVSQWLDSLPPDLSPVLPNRKDLLDKIRGFYKYPPLLLLARGTFTELPWSDASHCLPIACMNNLYEQIALAFRVTHVAEQGAIPLMAKTSPITEPHLSLVSSSSAVLHSAKAVVEKTAKQQNILRAPLAFKPLYGPFGERELPSSLAFDRAFWVHVRQHSISQEFAPLYTMFANGNVGEKRRLLTIAEVSKSSEREAAVDLFAGIGYFAFPLRKAGYCPVLCWELNEWSLEGFRRGGQRNHWSSYDVVTNETKGFPHGGNSNEPSISLSDDTLDRSDFLLFHESNVCALSRIDALRHRLPPIRHISCGYLPSSASCWKDAVRILDPVLGGWIHAHENCGAKDVDRRRVEVEKEFQATASDLIGPYVLARCEHVEIVKTYAPGVMHCVFDVRIRPG